jgi:hypothetical protein
MPGLCLFLLRLRASARDLHPLMSAATEGEIHLLTSVATTRESRVKPLKTRYRRVCFWKQGGKHPPSPSAMARQAREAPMAKHQHNGHVANRLFPPFIGFYRLFKGPSGGVPSSEFQAQSRKSARGLAHSKTLLRGILPTWNPPLRVCLIRTARAVGTLWNALARLRTLGDGGPNRCSQKSASLGINVTAAPDGSNSLCA